MPDNMNNVYSQAPQVEDRGCGNNGGIFGGNDTEVLFFIIIFLLLFTNFGYSR